MATLRFLLKRFAAQRLLGLAVVVTLAFSVGVLVAGPIYAEAAREAILSSELAGAAPTVKNARFQVFGDDSFDWGAADAVITDRIDSLPRLAGGSVRHDPRARATRGAPGHPWAAAGRGRGGAPCRRGAAPRRPRGRS